MHFFMVEEEIMALKLSLLVTILLVAPSAAQTEEPLTEATYVPGEVIVKLKDSPSGAIQALWQDPTMMQGHEAVFSRLQRRHGLAAEPVVAQRVGHRACFVLRTDRDVMAVCAA